MSTNNSSLYFIESNKDLCRIKNGKSNNNNSKDVYFEPEPSQDFPNSNQNSEFCNNISQIFLNEDSSENDENSTNSLLNDKNKIKNANSPEKTLPEKKKYEKSKKDTSINGDKKTKEKQNISEETRNKLNEVVESNENGLFDEIIGLNKTNKNITNQEINELNENQKKSKNNLDIEICNNIKRLFVIILIKLILDSKNDNPIINMNDFVKKQFYEERSIDILKKYVPENIISEINDIYNNNDYPKSREFLGLTPNLYSKNKINDLNKENSRIGNKQKDFRINGNSILNLIMGLATYLSKNADIEKNLNEKNKDKMDILNIIDNINNRIGEEEFLNDNLDKQLYDCNTNNNEINIINEMLDENYSNTNCSTNNTFNLEEIEKNLRKDNLLAKIKREKKTNESSFNKKYFEDFENKQINLYKNLKCKLMAIYIFISLNLDGLILLTKLITIEKGQYIKMKNSKEFENAIKSCIGQDFSLDLTEKEKKNIQERVKLLEYMVQNLKLFLKKKRKRNNSK